MKILLAVDDSACAEAAAHALAAYPPGADVRVLHVVEWPMCVPPCYVFAVGAAANDAVLESRDRMIAEADALVERFAGIMRRLGFKPHTFVAVGEAKTEILKCASDWGADLIVVGTHGRHGVDRATFGSVAEAVIGGASCPVATVRARVVGPAVAAV